MKPAAFLKMNTAVKTSLVSKFDSPYHNLISGNIQNVLFGTNLRTKSIN